MLWLNIGLVLFDVFWLLIAGYTGGQQSHTESMSLEGMDFAKRIVIVSSFVNMLLKVFRAIWNLKIGWYCSHAFYAKS